MYMCICFLTVDVGASKSAYTEYSFAATYEMVDRGFQQYSTNTVLKD